MAKHIVILICVAASVLRVDSLSDEQKEKILNLGMECAKEFPIDESEISKIKMKELPSSDNGKCMISCIMKKLGLMDDMGMISKENSLALADKEYKDQPDKLKAMHEFIHSCVAVNDEAVSDGAKGCERAYKALTCIHDKAPGFEVPV